MLLPDKYYYILFFMEYQALSDRCLEVCLSKDKDYSYEFDFANIFLIVFAVVFLVQYLGSHWK